MTTDVDILDPAELPAIITVDEASALLRVSKKAVYDMLRRDQLPGARKVGRSWRMHRDTILDWIRGGGS